MSRGKRLTFFAEWYQEEAALIRPFKFCFFTEDNAVELYDKRTNRVFLRRTMMPELSYRDIFIGAKIIVFDRTFDIVAYADETTKNHLARNREKTFVLLKNMMPAKTVAAVFVALTEGGFTVNNAMMAQFTPRLVKQFLNEENKGHGQTSALMNELLSGPAIGIEIIGDNAVSIIYECLAQTLDPEMPGMPKAFYKLCEQEEIRNGIYSSGNELEVDNNLKFFFSARNNLLKECEYHNSTLAIIKPHAVREGKIGKIIEAINSNGFRVSAMRMLFIARCNCEEFYEVYRGLLPEYIALVAQLASGVCMCLEVVCVDKKKSTQSEFRKFCGPMNPQIARLLRPKTLRAEFGSTKVKNALHCTDLPNDTGMELQYMFKMLDQTF